MFQGPPREKSSWTWSFFITWSCLIFIAVPFAPAVIRWISQYVSLSILIVGSLAIILAATVTAIVYLYRLSPRRHLKNLFWMGGILATYAYFCLYEVKADQEALHFVEYGFLGLLAFRALSHRVRDTSIYLSAILLVTCVATMDEIIQWMTPLRYFDLNDVKFDAWAALLSQIAIAKGMRPPFITSSLQPKSIRTLCRFAMVELFLLAFCVWNTPAHVVWYADRIPFLRPLANNESVMSEYGYRHVDRDIGAFYSRFTIDGLRVLDEHRGDEVGKIIAVNYKGSTNYQALLRLRTAGTDPYLHEAMAHIAQRNHYAASAFKFQSDAKRFKIHNTTAYGENLILEKYFPRVLDAAGERVTAQQVDTWKEHLNTDRTYKSQVSNHLLVQFREYELANLLIAVMLFVIFMRWFWGRERDDDAATS